jgi:glycosyltransferase involved in cell wall biosynthesis
MHVAFVSPGWPLEKFQNGIVTYVHWMKKELELRGHTVSVFSGSVEESDTNSGIYRIRPLSRLARFRLRFRNSPTAHVFAQSRAIAKSILAVHRRNRIDVIEMEESFGWFSDVGRITKIPVAVKLHGPAFLSLIGEEQDSDFAKEKIEREGLALQDADAIVSPSQTTLSQTIARYNLSPRISRHIVNPVTLDQCAPIWNAATCDRTCILFVGRFDLRKGADVILQAFSLLAKVRRDLHLIFVGPDIGIPNSQGNIEDFNSFCRKSLPQEVVARITFLGRLANIEIAKLRAQAAVTVIASRWENQGYTALEAMLQGCPIVSSNAGGLPENVVDEHTGRLAQSEDPEDFARKISAMLDEAQTAELLGNNARQYALLEHSPEKVAKESLQLYMQMTQSQQLGQ